MTGHAYHNDSRSPTSFRLCLTSQISGKDAAIANSAIWKVVAGGPKPSKFIETSWRAMKDGNAPGAADGDRALRVRILDLANKLNSDEFVARQKASAELLGLGEQAIPVLEAEMKTTKDPEKRRRAS